ncbi:MAG TPA: HAD-IA family hydrolase [Hyphomicrobiaceae bacterium]|nr:HAD-IA family hydrolase [Hyphomicrobiaceae bacterium]
MGIRAILFDKDGTIIDYWRTWVPINREVALFAANGDTALAEELLRAGGHDPATDRVTPGSVLAAGSVDDIAGAFRTRLGSRAPSRLEREIDRIFSEGGARHSVLLDGAAAAIAALHARGFMLGIATNDTIGGLEASLPRHDVRRWMVFEAGCDSGHGGKPAPGMVTAFAAAAGVALAEIAVVGDAVHDLEMARAAGAGLKVAVLSGTSPRETLAPHADLVLVSIADMPGHPAFAAVG